MFQHHLQRVSLGLNSIEELSRCGDRAEPCRVVAFSANRVQPWSPCRRRVAWLLRSMLGIGTGDAGLEGSAHVSRARAAAGLERGILLSVAQRAHVESILSTGRDSAFRPPFRRSEFHKTRITCASPLPLSALDVCSANYRRH